MRSFGWDRLEQALLSGAYSAKFEEMQAGKDDANYFKVTDGVVSLAGTAKGKFHTRPQIDIMHQIAHALPTEVTIGGVYKGFSFPIYNDDNEEIFFREHTPHRWDGVSDITVRVLTCLANTEDVSDSFRFKLMWNHMVSGQPVPASGTSKAVNVDQTILTGRNAQYDPYLLSFTMDYDADGVGDEIKDGEEIGIRLYRIGTSGTSEVTNDIIVLDWVTEFQTDKMYGEGD